MKQEFLLECYWGLTYRASLMHNNVYKDRNMKEINGFKIALQKFPPPHFPIARQIQKAFKIPSKQIINWTEMDSLTEYKKIIQIGREIQQSKKIKNLALLELELFNQTF